MITQEDVKSLFYYNEDGFLVRKKNVGRGARGRAGAIISSVDKNGYVYVSINKKQYRAHQIIFLWHHGYLPENVIDHIDRNKLNNKIDNLKEVSRTCNRINAGLDITNKSGVKGVSCDIRKKKWQAQIQYKGIKINLGYYSDFIEAACYRRAAEQCLGFNSCLGGL